MRGGRTRRRPDGCGPPRPALGWRRPGPARRPSPSGQPAARRACQQSWRRRGSAAGPPRAGRTASAPDHRRAAGYRTTGRPRRRRPARRALGHAHHVMQGRAFRVRIDEPGPPARRGCRTAATRARDRCNRPARTRTPNRTQSQIRLVPEEATGAAEPVAGGWVVGAAVTLGLAETVAVRLGELPIELLIVPRIPPPQSGGKQGHREGKSFRRTPHAHPSASYMADRWSLRLPAGCLAGRICLRHHRDCAAPRLGSDPAISAPWRRSRPRALSGKQRNCTTPYLERLIS